MSDLIDRQALLKQIDIDSDGEPGYYGDTWKFIGTIKSMPSAELDPDTISRQAAIDALRAMQTYKLFAGDDMFLIDQAGAQTELMMLPPAQPVQCEDAVSRQTLKDGFTEMCNLICPYSKKQQHVMCGSCLMGTAFDVLEATPPVTPKQRTGKWIKLDMHRGMADHKCTACEQECYVPTCMGEPLYAFCPNCGADMREVTE